MSRLSLIHHGFGLMFFGCLVGCASTPPVQQANTGPAAVITDSAIPDSRYKAMLFGISEIDGKPVDNVFEATRRSGQASNAAPFKSIEAAFVLSTTVVTRRVPAQPIRVKLRGSHVTGAPIHAIFSALSGEFNSVEGEVEFIPEMNHEYVVTGILSSNRASVWIEDTATDEPVTKKVQKEP